MATSLDSFFVSLGFEIDTDKLKEYEQKVGELRSTVLKIGTVFTAAAAGLGAMVIGVAKGMDDVGDFADIVGMSAREVDALGKVAKQNDSSMEAMKSTIQGLAQVTGEAALGVGRGAMTFEKLGFSAKNSEGKVKGASDMLGEVADRMKDMSASERLSLAGKLRIDPSLIPLLSKGRTEFAKLKEEADIANPLGDEYYKQADEIVKLYDKAKAGVGGLVKIVSASLFPVVKRVLKAYNDWFKASREVFNERFKAAIKLLSDMLGVVWDWVMRLKDALVGVWRRLNEFGNASYFAAGALGLLISYQAGNFFVKLGSAIWGAAKAMLALATPAGLVLMLIGAVGLAIGLLVDDYVGWKEGNDSLIGDLVKEFPGLLDVIHGIEDGVKAFGDFWLAQWEKLKEPLGDLWNALVGLWPVVRFLGGVLASFISWLLPKIISIAAFTIQAFTSILSVVIEVAAWLGQAFAAVFNLVYAVVSGTVANIKDLWGTLTDLLTGNFEGAANHLGKIWARFIGFWLDGWEKLKAGISWVADKLGFGDSTVQIQGAVQQAPAMNGGASAPAAAGSPAMATMSKGGVLGSAASNVSNSRADNSTSMVTIGAPNITVNNPDPMKAGEAVRAELERMNKQTIRNGQGGVAY